MVPADARRFRAVDEEAAAALASCDAVLVDGDADVEIAPIGSLRGSAPVALVRFGPTSADGEGRLRRIANRLRAHAAARVGTVHARKALARRGLCLTTVVAWDLEQRLRITRPRDRRGRAEPKLTLAERLPGGAVIVGSRSTTAPTMLDASIQAASAAAGGIDAASGCHLVRASGVLVSLFPRAVLRIALGPGRYDIERHIAGVELARSAAASVVTRRLPTLLGSGHAGLAYWAVESRLDGHVPSALSSSVLEDCLEFLVDLHSSRRVGASVTSLTAPAAVVGMLCDRDRADALTALARRLDAALAGIERGVGHGDFWRGNLLTGGGRLRGVVDWAGARADQLPLLDLINLLVAERESKYFGRALPAYLLPWARAGGDAISRAYCARLGMDFGPLQLEMLAITWWLERVARELELYGDRVRRPQWIDQNVTMVLDALLAGGSRWP